METMYNTSCMAERILELYPESPAKGDMAHCVISRYSNS
jgi:hypothetical protein